MALNPDIPETMLSLEEYFKYLAINECAALGIRRYPTTGAVSLGCGDQWDYQERYFLAQAIKKAEDRSKLDRWLGFPFRRSYYYKQWDYDHTRHMGKHIRQMGAKTVAEIEDVTLELSPLSVIADPVTFTVTVDFTNENELVVYYPDTTHKIRPSKISITGTTGSIEIPRCRLLEPDMWNANYADDVDRPDYNDDANFITEVTVAREYVDTTTGVNVAWNRRADDILNSELCFGVNNVPAQTIPVGGDVRQLVAPYVQDQRLGAVTVEPATYSEATATWSTTSWAVGRIPDFIEANYMRGKFELYEELDSNLVRAIIAIAHNNMPRDYCGCSVQHLYWEDDNKPLEPPVNLGLGPSTWGIYEASQIFHEYDNDRQGYRGGML